MAAPQQIGAPPETRRFSRGLNEPFRRGMGKRIVRCFEQADALGGLVARMRLASLSQVTSMEAETIDDSAERVARVQHALEEIRKQFAAEREDKTAPSVVVRTGVDQIHVLRRYLATYLDMMAQRSLFLGDTNTTVRRVTEAGSALALERRPSDLSRDASDEPTSSLRVIAPIAAARGEPG